MRNEKSRAILPSDKLNDSMIKINEDYLDTYEEYYWDEGSISEETYEKYYGVYKNMFQFKENWDIPFHEYTLDTVDRFLNAYINLGDSRRNQIIAYINQLKKVLIEKWPDKFSYDFLRFPKVSKPENKKPPAKSLNQIQINALKQLFSSPGLIDDDSFIFTAMYYDGIFASDIDKYNPFYTEIQDHCVIHGEDKYPISTELEAIYPFVKRRTIYSKDVAHTLDRINSFLRNMKLYKRERKIEARDIKLTRSTFFFKCPCCKRTVENIAENWVIVKYIERNRYGAPSLTCKYCQGVINDDEL